MGSSENRKMQSKRRCGAFVLAFVRKESHFRENFEVFFVGSAWRVIPEDELVWGKLCPQNNRWRGFQWLRTDWGCRVCLCKGSQPGQEGDKSWPQPREMAQKSPWGYLLREATGVCDSSVLTLDAQLNCMQFVVDSTTRARNAERRADSQIIGLDCRHNVLGSVSHDCKMIWHILT